MSEGICTWGSDVKNRGYPNQEIFNLYERWSRGGFGMSITGNVMVNPVKNLRKVLNFPTFVISVLP